MTALPEIDSMFLRRYDRLDVPRHASWGGPFIVPEGGGKREYYQRVSTFAGLLDGPGGLPEWQSKVCMIGLTRRDALRRKASTTHPDDKEAWREIIREARAAGGGDDRRDLGTALHAATEHVDLGGAVGDLDKDLRADVEAYLFACEEAGLTPDAGEVFVVNDRFKIAGTFDREMSSSSLGEHAIGDLKTGSSDADYPHKAALQIACYASSRRYALDGRRSELGVSQEVGYLIHLPAGSASCRIMRLDLTMSMRMLKVAALAKAWKKYPVATEVAAVSR